MPPTSIKRCEPLSLRRRFDAYFANLSGRYLPPRFIFVRSEAGLEIQPWPVAPGVAFAAAHVVEPLIPHIVAEKLRIFCAGYTSSGPRYWRMPVNFRLLDLDDRLCGIDRRDVIRASVDDATGLTRVEWDEYT
jgi:hypothetical protein